jgi:RNA polymerase sigma-70 factor (ECF subfamily)
MAIDEGVMAIGLARIEPGTTAAQRDEGEAIERLIAAGEHREALARCARAYALALGRLCMAFTGSQAESEELVQETLIAAFDGFPQYRAEGSIKAWLFSIARRLCGRHVEMRARRSERLRLVHDTSRGRDAGEMALEKERAERARAALAKLKPSEREAVVLRYEGELSFRELGIACGLDEAAARKRVSRALARLRADLGEE